MRDRLTRAGLPHSLQRLCAAVGFMCYAPYEVIVAKDHYPHNGAGRNFGLLDRRFSRYASGDLSCTASRMALRKTVRATPHIAPRPNVTVSVQLHGDSPAHLSPPRFLNQGGNFSCRSSRWNCGSLRMGSSGQSTLKSRRPAFCKLTAVASDCSAAARSPH